MLHHKGTQEIKTHRLILRRYKLSDAQYMYKNITYAHFFQHFGKKVLLYFRLTEGT